MAADGPISTLQVQCIRAAASTPHWRMQSRVIQALPHDLADALLEALLATDPRVGPTHLTPFRQSASVLSLDCSYACPPAFKWRARQSWVGLAASMPYLQRLHLCGVAAVQDRHWERLAALAPSLLSLSLVSCDGSSGEGLSTALAALSRLTSLALDGTVAVAPKSLPALPGLRALALHRLDLGPAGRAALSCLTNLTALDLSDCPDLSDEAAREIGTLSLLQSLNLAGTRCHCPPMAPTLTSLDMSHCDFNVVDETQDLVWVEMRSTLPLLAELLLDDAVLSDSGWGLVRRLMAGAGGSLTRLELPCKAVCEHPLHGTPDLPPRLEVLKLSGCTTSRLPFLPAKSLKNLNVHYLLGSDQPLWAQLTELTTLRDLSMSGMSGSFSAWLRLAVSLPLESAAAGVDYFWKMPSLVAQEDMQGLHPSTSLRSLSVRLTYLSATAHVASHALDLCRALVSLAPRLQRLSISLGWGGALSDECLGHIAGLTHLTRLTLASHLTATPKGLMQLSGLLDLRLLQLDVPPTDPLDIGYPAGEVEAAVCSVLPALAAQLPLLQTVTMQRRPLCVRNCVTLTQEVLHCDQRWRYGRADLEALRPQQQQQQQEGEEMRRLLLEEHPALLETQLDGACISSL